ncbi:ribosomal protein S5 domain 2-type protein [Geranomyces variabilis]|nr:ribosomal protein S5 domain 2-type protein [Geranomyces variabilis]
MNPSEEAENRALQEEEILALSSIYDADFTSDSPDSFTIRFRVPADPSDATAAAKELEISLACHLPTTYPSREPPYYELVTDWRNDAGIPFGVSDVLRRGVDDAFTAAFVEGEVCVFEWVEALKMILETSEPLVERKSIFVAHAAPITSAADAALVVSALLTNKRIRRATHNIVAWRVLDGGIVRQDCDDDGETAAGGRLLHMLDLAKADGVVVVVSRWYGGIHLGPARFKCINNCARKLLESEGYIAAGEGKKGRNAKKR